LLTGGEHYLTVEYAPRPGARLDPGIRIAAITGSSRDISVSHHEPPAPRSLRAQTAGAFLVTAGFGLLASMLGVLLRRPHSTPAASPMVLGTLSRRLG